MKPRGSDKALWIFVLFWLLFLSALAVKIDSEDLGKGLPETPLATQIRINTGHLERIEEHLRNLDIRTDGLQRDYYDIKTQLSLNVNEVYGHRWLLATVLVALIGNIAAIMFSRKDTRAIELLRRDVRRMTHEEDDT